MNAFCVWIRMNLSHVRQMSLAWSGMCLIFLFSVDGARLEADWKQEFPTGVWNSCTFTRTKRRSVGTTLLSGLKDY